MALGCCDQGIGDGVLLISLGLSRRYLGMAFLFIAGLGMNGEVCVGFDGA